ncbi:hypothetical protein QBK99_23365 [Corticibacterium sp. UT-5YL-CI-8]|nr:hypothetical protein [Tianweitania sp. UT-5YL-CI-8]
MSDTDLLERFITWGKELVAGASSSSMSIELEVGAPTDNPAARLDFESAEICARITFWSDRSFVLEALDAETSAQLLFRLGRAPTSSVFNEEFSDILRLVAAR